jgi:hypothetical protein
MPKQKRTTHLQAKQNAQQKSKPDLRIEQTEERTSPEKLSNSLAGSAGDDPVQTHAVLLSNTRIPIIQRQVIATQIGQMAGNQYLQRVILQRQGIPSKEKGSVQDNKVDPRLIAQVKELVSPSIIQLAPSKPRWRGRGGSKWAPLPWTYDELKRLKAAELRDAKTEKDRRLLNQKYFRGEQVIKNWNNRYGKWAFPLTDPWAQWFQSQMKPYGKFSYRPDELWRAFLRKRATSASPWHREVAINPFWPEKEKVQYELYKDELESRDPTSIEFFKPYSKYIDSARPRALVEPPKKAQKFLIESSYAKPMSNEHPLCQYR